MSSLRLWVNPSRAHRRSRHRASPTARPAPAPAPPSAGVPPRQSVHRVQSCGHPGGIRRARSLSACRARCGARRRRRPMDQPYGARHPLEVVCHPHPVVAGEGSGQGVAHPLWAPGAGAASSKKRSRTEASRRAARRWASGTYRSGAAQLGSCQVVWMKRIQLSRSGRGVGTGPQSRATGAGRRRVGGWGLRGRSRLARRGSPTGAPGPCPHRRQRA